MTKIEVKLNPDVEPTGSDLAVVNAARRSFGKRSKWGVAMSEDELGKFQYPALKFKDKRLIEFLARGMTADDFEEFKLKAATTALEWQYYMDNNEEENFVEKLWEWRNTPTHDTPFNHCFLSFEVKAPIFVARQLVKHEYLIFSEFSRRYVTDDIEFYEPDYWRKAAPNKKQGSLEEPVDENNFGVAFWKIGQNTVSHAHERQKEHSLDLFKGLVEHGVAPEQARMVLPQSTMTEWTWSGTLGAFAKMCRLRLHPDAQYESKLVAEEVYNHLKEYYPVSAKALVEGPDV